MDFSPNVPNGGDYYSVKMNGDEWAVLICDEDMTVEYFTGEGRPLAARQADGTWGQEYRAGGSAFRQRCFPALCLGTMEFRWVPWNLLEMIDEGFGEAIVLSTKNVVLKTAWTEYVEQFNGYGLAQWKDLAYWKARLAAAHGGKAPLSRSQKERAQPERRKRKVNPVFKYPGYRAEAVDDDGGGIFLPRRDSGAPNIKQEPHEPASSAEMDAWYDDDDDPHYRMKSSKRSKLDTRGRVSPRPTPPLRTESRSGFSTPTPFPAGPSSLLQRKKRNDPEKITIYVGTPHRALTVNRSGLSASRFLAGLAAHDPKHGWYIMSPELSRLDPDVFTAVAEYLDRGEYGPNILDEGGLEDTLDPESLVHEVTRCGTIYAMAQELDVPGLQALVFRKLQALAPYHQPAEVLDVVALVFARGEEDIRQYLVWLLVEGWWDFVFEVPEKLFVAMTSDAVLAKGVYAKLGEIAEVEDEVRKEGVEDAQSGKGKGKQSVDNAEKASESNSAEAKVARR